MRLGYSRDISMANQEMKIIIAFTLSTFFSIASFNVADATSFTMTTEADGDTIGFIDTDTISLVGEIGKVMSYVVVKTDLPIPIKFPSDNGQKTYAVSASEVWFECKTHHYSMNNLFFYDAHGQFVRSYNHPVVVDQPIPPQTGLDEQFKYVCNGAKPSNQMKQFNDFETPLQTLIRATRATLNDPRYVP